MSQPKEPMLAAVVRRLRESKGKWREISRESGVPYATLTHLAQGHSADPRISTLQPLHDYFEAQPAAVEPGSSVAH
ncbi:hypothetical protein F3J20_22635 [Paraburkholderia sp. Cy-641]|uniref:hypothetical protein n=1 Tax=Paraburkholderia sp. Cy-641 TaxID=2608337 RepID=UPI001423B610|nr:hypothetical protein [Paraburkholderia sp. Cy-641]NIF80155.1 hypothetical protein [Paraburkholderia sp. Cy-641]